ncbi:MAG: glycosyl hydrolase [Actinophytocola sp.]|nr:glycosyl hydrolase [Actinophytocola sp.]
MSQILAGDVRIDVWQYTRSLTLEQKVRMLTGADFWSLHPEPAAGLRRLVVSDGPAGVRGESWDERDPSANVPSPTALAATWDPERIERVGGLLAEEARRKGVDVLLAPTVNLHRTPHGGRHFECFSEDPLLTAAMGTAYVQGVQARGVGATVKHFVANDSETERLTLDARIDERALRELYLAPFETIVREGGAWAVMAAYNGVNGTTMTESPMLREILKQEWGFDGVVMSDWFAARSLAAAGPGLLDLVMPGPAGPWGEALVDAVRAGKVPESAVDDKVMRILRLAARVGALDGIASAVRDVPGGYADVGAELRAAAAAGFVLASNTGSMLPLDVTGLSRVAVLGANASVARTLGGGSATVAPPYVVSPLDGIRTAVGDDVEVVHGAGGRTSGRVPTAQAGSLTAPDGSNGALEVRFLDTAGNLLTRQQRHATTLLWSGVIADGIGVRDVAAIEVHASFCAPQPGRYLVGGSGLGRFTLTADDATVHEEVTSLADGADVVEGMMRPPQAVTTLDLAEGQEVDLVLRYEPGAVEHGFGEAEVAMLALQLNIGLDSDDDAELEHAVRQAAESDVAVVVVGTTEEVESEGFDRTTLALPGRQDELVRRVAEVNLRTVVVVNAGAPVLLPWADDVAAVLIAWFPGQEFGNALADVLLGIVEPGGRLPMTWPREEAGHPSVTPVEGTLPYDEGIFVGYRAYERDGRKPRYAFGHGLGYTEWSYEDVSVLADQNAAGGFALTVRLRNTGGRPGREVVQVYASRPDSAVERPRRWLAGFATVDAESGEVADVDITVPARALAHWDTTTGWTVEPGDYRLEVGRSLADLRLVTEVRAE